jgi:ADP-ribosylglycohydrolase
MNSQFEGLLLGTAIGDALGLPAEGLSRERIQRRWGGVWKMRLVFGRGLISDDTEHTVLVAHALAKHPNDAEAFQGDLARRLRWWFAALPPGVGLATAKACLKLWFGISPRRSGVFSAGNGPAMRSAIIGLFFAHDPAARRDYVRASTHLTHTDPKAEVAALAVAEAAACQATETPIDNFILLLESLSSDDEWQFAVSRIQNGIASGWTVNQFALELGLERRVSGYAYHTVPMAIYTWLIHRTDFRNGLEAVLNCGGDTDTVGAIAGALLGLSGSADAIPKEWLDRMADWPLSLCHLRDLAVCLEDRTPAPLKSWHQWLMPVRNMILLVVVIIHGFRRLV